MPKLTDDALLGELLGGLWAKASQIDTILRAGYLPQSVVNALVDAKLSLIALTKKLQAALESEQDSNGDVG